MPFQKDGKQGVLGGTEFIAEAIDDLKPFRAGILEEEAVHIGLVSLRLGSARTVKQVNLQIAQ